jgi:hypothetical protein
LAKRNRKSWRCFHCDEVFRNYKAAREHFGLDDFELKDPPACLDPLRRDEKARMREVFEARAEAVRLQQQLNATQEELGLFHAFQKEIGRYFGTVGGVIASTPHQAYLVLEAARNEVQAWREKYEGTVGLHKHAQQYLMAGGDVVPDKCGCGRTVEIISSGAGGRRKCSGCEYGPERCKCAGIAGTLEAARDGGNATA